MVFFMENCRLTSRTASGEASSCDRSDANPA